MRFFVILVVGVLGCSSSDVVNNQCDVTLSGPIDMNITAGCTARVTGGGRLSAEVEIKARTSEGVSTFVEVHAVDPDWEIGSYTADEMADWELDVAQDGQTQSTGTKCDGCGPVTGTVTLTLDNLSVGADFGDGSHDFVAHGSVDAELVPEPGSTDPGETIHVEF